MIASVGSGIDRSVLYAGELARKPGSSRRSALVLDPVGLRRRVVPWTLSDNWESIATVRVSFHFG
ncbi:MAG: hypothetical protein ACP5O0_02075 [Acidimicrobiales bacterium]